MDSRRIGFARSHGAGEPLPKVLLVIEASGGGSGRHVVELAEGLVAAGCEVHLIYSDLRADHAFRSQLRRIPGLRAHRLDMRREPHWSDLPCVLQVRRYLQRHGGFDVVHAHSSKAGVIARLAATGLPCVRIYTPHAMRTMDPTLHPLAREFYRAIEVSLARALSDSLIAVSESERLHVVEQGVPAGKTFMVANGIPAPEVPRRGRTQVRAELGLAPEDVCIGFIGRLVPQKAPERFLATVARVARQHPRLRAVVVGSGPLQGAARAAAREAGIADRVTWVTDRPGPAVLPAFDVLLMPSLYEGMPYVLLEALAVGVPVLATRVGGVDEAIEPGVTGFVVAQDDAHGLEARLRTLVEQDDLRAAMSEASIRKSREMSIERMVEQTLQVYRSALHDRSARQQHVPLGLDPKRAA